MTLDDDAPHVPPPSQTLVMDEGSGEQLLWIDGLLTVPVGARLEFNDRARFDAVVTRVRVWGVESPESSTLVLDVMRVAPDEHLDRP